MPMTTATERRLLRVLDHIHSHPAADLSLDALADVAAMSRFHWHRLFHAYTGETAAQTVRRLRMHRASVALVRSDQPVARIAREVGYPNMASFARAFRESFGMTPLAFRKQGELRPYTPRTPKETPDMYPVIIREEPARRLAAMPHRGPYHEIGRAFEKLSAIMGTRGLFAHAGLMVAAYYDDPAATKAADLRSHAGFDMAPSAPALEAPLETVSLPAGPHAVLTYKGPYAGLPAAYDQLYRNWLPQSGHEPEDSPPIEIYLNSPMDTAPENLVTEIAVPLKAQG